MPITISKDPSVFQSIADWKWQDGVFPTPKASLWRMDRFRDSFLSAFGAR